MDRLKPLLAPIVALCVLLGDAVVTAQISSQRPAFEEATVAGIDQSIRNHDRRELTTTTFFDRTDLLQFIVAAYLDADGAGACAVKIRIDGECPPIVGSVPAWMRTEKFEVAAKFPSASLPADAIDRLRDFRFTSAARKNVYPLPVQLMLQRLLEETFDLNVRRERREVPVWAITARKEPTLLRSSAVATTGITTNGLVLAKLLPGPPLFAPGSPVQLVFEGSTLKDAADFFSVYLDRPVVDRTGLDGEYDFTFEFKAAPRMSSAPWKDMSAGWVPLMVGFDAARLAAGLDALGLTLEPATASFDVLVIEDAQRATSN